MESSVSLVVGMTMLLMHVCFFFFCVGHLLGRNNVIDRLRKKGYAVQHIPVSESIEG